MAPTYRVVKKTTDDFGVRKVTEEVIWQGTDLAALSRQYPPSEVFGADLLGHSEIEDGLIRFDHHFDRLIPPNTWEEIGDPRFRLMEGMTPLEREIDAENRRLYPGDYADEDVYMDGLYATGDSDDDIPDDFYGEEDPSEGW